jgi:hypothetical protein
VRVADYPPSTLVVRVVGHTQEESSLGGGAMAGFKGLNRSNLTALRTAMRGISVKAVNRERFSVGTFFAGADGLLDDGPEMPDVPPWGFRRFPAGSEYEASSSVR